MRNKPKNGVEKADVLLAEKLTPLIGKRPVQIIGTLSDVGDQPPLYTVAGGVVAAGLVLNDPRTLRAGARMLAAHVVATTVKDLFKRSIDRTRPDKAARDGVYERGKGRRSESPYNSFPSGHTASSVAVARAVSREYPGQHDLALGVASAIAVTQVIRGKHFVSDIVAGAAIGIVTEMLVDAAFRRFHPDVEGF